MASAGRDCRLGMHPRGLAPGAAAGPCVGWGGASPGGWLGDGVFLWAVVGCRVLCRLHGQGPVPTLGDWVSPPYATAIRVCSPRRASVGDGLTVPPDATARRGRPPQREQKKSPLFQGFPQSCQAQSSVGLGERAVPPVGRRDFQDPAVACRHRVQCPGVREFHVLCTLVAHRLGA